MTMRTKFVSKNPNDVIHLEFAKKKARTLSHKGSHWRVFDPEVFVRYGLDDIGHHVLVLRPVVLAAAFGVLTGRSFTIPPPTQPSVAPTAPYQRSYRGIWVTVENQIGNYYPLYVHGSWGYLQAAIKTTVYDEWLVPIFQPIPPPDWYNCFATSDDGSELAIYQDPQANPNGPGTWVISVNSGASDEVAAYNASVTAAWEQDLLDHEHDYHVEDWNALVASMVVGAPPFPTIDTFIRANAPTSLSHPTQTLTDWELVTVKLMAPHGKDIYDNWDGETSLDIKGEAVYRYDKVTSFFKLVSWNPVTTTIVLGDVPHPTENMYVTYENLNWKDTISLARQASAACIPPSPPTPDTRTDKQKLRYLLDSQ